MSIQWKSALIIIATLVIGIVIGVFLAGPVLHRHIGPGPGDRGGAMFMTMLERIIQPTADQEDAVREILERHAAKLDFMHEEFRIEMVATMDSLRKELDPILTDEQKARLDDRRGHFKHFEKGGPRRHGRRPEPPERPDTGGPGMGPPDTDAGD